MSNTGIHPLVVQLRFTRSEFVRGLSGVNDPQAQQRFGRMNCISWIIGHLAWQEQRYWLQRAQSRILIPDLVNRLAYGKPACTPPVEEMWADWRQVTQEADSFLDQLTTEKLQAPLAPGLSSAGTFLQRVIYHYWYHLGEGMAIRQMLSDEKLPDFVGDIDALAPYLPENGSLATPLNISQFIQQLSEARSRLDSLFAILRDEQWLEAGASGNWTAKDVLAHITWHDQEMLGFLKERRLAGSEWWLKPTDERNQLIYEAFRRSSLETVRDQANKTYAQLVQELNKLSDEDLYDSDHFVDMPADWRLADLIASNTTVHYQDHYADLRDWWQKTQR